MKFSLLLAAPLATALLLPMSTPANAAPAAPAVKTSSEARRMGLPRECQTGRVVCIDKHARKMYWVVNGDVKRTMNTRIGRAGMRTKSGMHRIYWKHKNHVSRQYKAPMPYSQFFYQGQALHDNPDWDRTNKYGRGSHGCANLKMADAKYMWYQTRVGDKVFVYGKDR